VRRLALAKNLNIAVQESYSLAEIYNERRSGFEEAENERTEITATKLQCSRVAKRMIR